MDEPFKELAFSWRHIFMFVIDQGILKFWAFKDGKEKFEDVDWREDFRQALDEGKPQMHAIEHGNATKLVVVAGTFLHVFDFYEYGATFQ